VLASTVGYQRSTWAGNPANVYDTARSASLGSSSGSATSVSANLCMASLGEETRASTRGPANHNATALILPAKGMLSFHGGAVGSDIYCDRTGILCRTLEDCAKVFDALQDPGYDPRDPYTTIPRAPSVRFSDHLRAGSLEGRRIGIVRESMLTLDTKATEPISTAAAAEIKLVLGDQLGATLVESRHPLWTPDGDLEQMEPDFTRALARLAPVFMPDLLFRPEFAPAIEASGLAPIDYLVELADGRVEPPANLDLATVQDQAPQLHFRYHLRQYLARRASDWAELGVTESLVDFAELNARSKFWGDDQRAAFRNWEEVSDPRNPQGERQGVVERIMLRELLRRVDVMVMRENRLDALVRLHTQLPPAKIGGAPEPGLVTQKRLESCYGPNAGLTEILVPAGFVTTVYDADFALSADGARYVGVASDRPATPPPPGLPFSFVFRAEPGQEHVVIEIASAYEAATRHRTPPPAFGRVAPIA
jgi:Asp-tRNA(Asn)/Glu-tRNA(Gln) amidotransferase A subunit family amidase